MSISTLASLRQFPEFLRPQLQVAYAAAREAIVETHQSQAVRFTTEFSQRMPPLDALDLYFKVVPVPQSMVEDVVSKTLVGLDFDRLPVAPAAPSLLADLKLFRPGVWGLLRRRRQGTEITLQLAQLAGARAADAVLDTHVLNAARVVEILHDAVWVDDAVSHYIHTFRLPLSTAYMVYQRTRAMVADRRLAEMMAPIAEEPMLPVRRELQIGDRPVRIAG